MVFIIFPSFVIKISSSILIKIIFTYKISLHFAIKKISIPNIDLTVECNGILGNFNLISCCVVFFSTNNRATYTNASPNLEKFFWPYGSYASDKKRIQNAHFSVAAVCFSVFVHQHFLTLNFCWRSWIRLFRQPLHTNTHTYKICYFSIFFCVKLIIFSAILPISKSFLPYNFLKSFESNWD